MTSVTVVVFILIIRSLFGCKFHTRICCLLFQPLHTTGTIFQLHVDCYYEKTHNLFVFLACHSVTLLT